MIALPPKLFYGTGIPGCVLILNKNKPEERKHKIILIHAAKDYQEGKVRNILREQDIERMVKSFKDFQDVKGYCHIANFEELKENDFNLNIPRYVDISVLEEDIDIQITIDELKKLENERLDISNQVKHDLKELGFVI